MWSYEANEGLWSQNKEAFQTLCMANHQRLGKYGTMVSHMNRVYSLAGTVKPVSPAWTQALNTKTPPGQVPCGNGMHNLATGVTRPFQPSDMLTAKLTFDAPAAGENFPNEDAFVRTMVDQLYPEAALRSDVMKRFGVGFFLGDPAVIKEILQLTGEGNNGKTTIFNVLTTAFPEWVGTIEPDHLYASSKQSDPNAAQPWIMDVMGKRLVFCEEGDANAIYNGKLLCKLRGGLPLTARALYGNNVTCKPTWFLTYGGNAAMDIKPLDAAVQRSIAAFCMPSTFVSAGDPRLGQPLVFLKVEQLERRFEQRGYKIALLRLLYEFYQEYERDGLAPLGSQYDDRSIYAEAEEAKTNEQWFNEYFDVLDADDGTRLTTRDIHQTLKANGYPHSEPTLAPWLNRYFQVRTNGNGWAFGHASVKKVNHQNRKVLWVCIAHKGPA